MNIRNGFRLLNQGGQIYGCFKRRDSNGYPYKAVKKGLWAALRKRLTASKMIMQAANTDIFRTDMERSQLDELEKKFQKFIEA